MKLKKFYTDIFTFKYLIKFGYIDFQKSKNPMEYSSSILSGKADTIYTNYFNFSDFNSEILDELEKISYSSTITEPVIFSIPKKEEVRRTLKIPNLYSYINLAKVILENKVTIIDTLSDNKHSLSKLFNVKPYDFQTTDGMREKKLFGKVLFYKTDFNSFYHSMYTHSIAWLVETKEVAKNKKDDKDLFGNKLDKAIRAEQYGETHGLPTGNLLTRIIVEFVMAKFDTELDQSIKNDEEIEFTRYVDDITIAYNSDDTKNNFMSVLRRLSDKYEFVLNESKSHEMSYPELTNQSVLMDYFKNIKINKKNKLKKIKSMLLTYLRISLDEQKKGIKGADKLVFTGIRFLIVGTKNTLIKKMILQAMAYKENDESISIMQMLIQRSILDSRMSIYLMQLIDEIYSQEKKIGNSTLQKHLVNTLIENRKNFEKRIKMNLELNKHQEVYSSILLYVRNDVQFEKQFIIDFFESIKKEDIEVDDLSFLLLLPELRNLPQDTYVDIIDNICDFMHYGIDCHKDPFVQKHWLLRYELLRMSKYDSRYINAIDSFYDRKQILTEYRYLNVNNLKMYLIKNKVINSKKKPVAHKVADFYLKLLDWNIKFSKI
jgi:hypothetical protein